MHSQFLRPLIRKYSKNSSLSIDPMGDIAKRYKQYKNTQALDLAIVSISLGIQPINNHDMNPLALKALHDTNPNFDPSYIGSYSDQEWMGIVNSAKGKYFEYLVVDKLNSGEAVGDLVLPYGYSAQIAQSMNQPGWDLSIVDSHGQIAELLQLKATENIGYISQTLDRYPDISILTTHEVSNKIMANDMIIDSNISESEIEAAINSAAIDSEHGYISEFWDYFHPLVPLLFIAGTQGYHVVMKKQTVGYAVEIAKNRAKRSIVSGATGAAVKMVSGSWLFSAIAAFTAGMIFDRSVNIDELLSFMKKYNNLLRIRSNHYRNLIIKE